MIEVLIVEDDPMVAAINAEYLSRIEGFVLRESYTSSRSCLDGLAGHEDALVLLDVFMPGISGIELLRRIRNEHPRVDVIMITADRNSQDIKTALRLGIIDYLMKPFTFERFQAALLAYRERRSLLNANHELDQSALDRRIFIRTNVEHPKGVDSDTLRLVERSLSERTGHCSLKDLESETGLSRVSIKKYLVYLENTGKVTSRLEYPAVGRPVRKYRSAPS